MSYGAKCELARNINATSEVLDELSKHKSIYIKWLVSNNPNTSTKTFEYLASLENEYINISLTRSSSFIDYKTNRYPRENLPKNINSILYRKHFSQPFKSYFVAFPSISKELLNSIYNEENQDIYVIRNIIGNSNCPEELIENEFYNHRDYSLYIPGRSKYSKVYSGIYSEESINNRKNIVRKQIKLIIARKTKNINIIRECVSDYSDGYYSEKLRRTVYSNINCPDDIVKNAIHNDPDQYNRKYAGRIYYRCLE